jgi:glycosyltransferase involved in cell wall biosynthesis
MKVVHVSAYFAPAWGFGGPSRSLLSLCRAQLDQGMTVEVFTTTANRGPELPACPDGIDVQGVRVRYFPLQSPRWLLGSAAMQAPLRKAAAGADVVHLHGLFNRTVWTAASAVQSLAPYILSPRGMLTREAWSHHRWRKQAAWWTFDRRVVAEAAALHATSAEERSLLARYAPPDRVVQIGHGVDPIDDPIQRLSAVASAKAEGAPAADGRAAIGLPPDVPYVLFLGRIHRLKRVDLLVDAFRIAAADDPELFLVIAGPDEHALRRDLEQRLGELSARVKWPGVVDGVFKNRLLRDALTLVLCSDSESFGMAVAEALAAGVPPVVSHGCPWAILEAAQSGFFVPQEATAIARAITTLRADPDLRTRMSARATLLATNQFSWAAAARAFQLAYSSVVRAAPVRGLGGPVRLVGR